MKTKTINLEPLRPLSSTSRNHFANIEYSSSSCTGHCDDYCRCSVICNAKIIKIDTKLIIDAVIPKEHNRTIFGYCVERIMRICGVFYLSNWEVNIIDGYYGQETNGVSLTYESYKLVTKHFDLLISLNNTQKIEYILKLEYGYILPILLNKNWEINRVARSKISAGQTNYYDRKLSPQIVSQYTDHSFPIGVCIEESDGNYRLIDGYHRFSASENKRTVLVVVANQE